MPQPSEDFGACIIPLRFGIDLVLTAGGLECSKWGGKSSKLMDEFYLLELQAMDKGFSSFGQKWGPKKSKWTVLDKVKLPFPCRGCLLVVDTLRKNLHILGGRSKASSVSDMHCVYKLKDILPKEYVALL